MTRYGYDVDPVVAPAAGEWVTSVTADALWLVDILLEGMVCAASWIGRAFTRPTPRSRTPERPLQVISAMTMVNDHVLRDVGLDRTAIGAIGVLSVEEIDGCRVERQVA